jgi:hypothetical protein
MARGKYSVSFQSQTISTAITLLEIVAPSTAAIVLYRAWISANTTTAGAANIQILRKSATGTSAATAPTPAPLDASAASGATIKWKESAEGTASNIIYDDWFRVDGGPWIWLPVPEERVIVPPSGIIALKFATAPASNSFSCGIVYEELG